MLRRSVQPDNHGVTGRKLLFEEVYAPTDRDLVPETFLRTDIDGLIFDIDDVEQVKALAKRYQVSAQAMNLRLVNLFSRPCRRKATSK